VTAELEADAKCFGLILEGFDEDDDTEGLWPEHEDAAIAFQRVQTQWRLACLADGSVRYVGLDYPGVGKALEFAGIEMTPALFAQLQVIEAGVIDADAQETSW